MRDYGMEPDTKYEDNFADAGNTYYTNYLAAAKCLGISGGMGNNMFAPDKEMSRQEMFTLLYNSLKIFDELPPEMSGLSLSTFSDAGQIISWVKDATTLLVKARIIRGNEGKLSPADMVTRAEMAKVLYNLLRE